MIGILGGTFDPVHFGHLRPALELLEGLPLDELRLLPCGVPPHRDAPAVSAAHRRAMLERAIDGQPGFRIDTRELDRPGPSYMVDTLASLREELGAACPIALILGMDAFLGLPTWHRWERIPQLAHLLVMERPGARLPEDGPLAALVQTGRADAAQALRESPSGRILTWSVTQLDISATRIRALVADGRSVRYLLPAAVNDYIHEHGLYAEPRGFVGMAGRNVSR
ncbi:MAG: nicotinate-nucleotide adenylyltransferase [Chromatiales bacterium]|jgi:nicotinate-nucleotide adenylyltransferase|nr:nicotinate-nucleotide adenylyltransferase [Chromatiales bacterium]MDX9768243.1 nicotinate-nucleotide adenylyltransferase [Ectothiorhodospiraceae bacterium]